MQCVKAQATFVETTARQTRPGQPKSPGRINGFYHSRADEEVELDNETFRKPPNRSESESHFERVWPNSLIVLDVFGRSTRASTPDSSCCSKQPPSWAQSVPL